jgi:hypothetical protein
VKRTAAILALSLWCAYSQTGSKKPPGTTAKTVTVKGCIYQGVECLVLKDSKRNQDYSVGRTDKLQVGHAYRITGSVSDVGSCLEGKPILAPRKITEVKLKCQMEGKK